MDKALQDLKSIVMANSTATLVGCALASCLLFAAQQRGIALVIVHAEQQLPISMLRAPHFKTCNAMQVDDDVYAKCEALMERLLELDDVDAVYTNCDGLNT